MNERYPHARLLIFAKVPSPGRAKTRLIPLLGEVGAAQLQAQLLWRTVTMASRAQLAPVELWLAGEGGGELRQALGERYPQLQCFQQSGRDLGERMFHAAASGDSNAPVVIIGSDCPAMDPHVLEQAFVALEDHPLVFQPAEDGGYTLIGLRQPRRELFQDIDWGSARVLAQSLQRAEVLAWPLKQLAMGWDLDRPEDYRRALAESLIEPIDH